MMLATLNSNLASNALVNALNRSHIIVDKINDLFCLSSFFSPWFPDYYFSGGTAFDHSALADIRLLAVSMPMCNRGPWDFICSDCHNDLANDPGSFSVQVEICRQCIASWVSKFRDIERVYLIVPGVRRAQIGDEEAVYRWGEPATIQAAIDSLPKPFLHTQVADDVVLPATGTRPAITLQSTETIAPFGPERPRCFYGCGITLFEVPAAEVPDNAVEILECMVKDARNLRQEDVEEGHSDSPYPRNPIHCGGAVEFKFLSF
ncbi:hypothetical protein INS49_010635 [Diaporthe citri]|uniref:uncharacterized protein n=1 Tax=Diaporthe citri TaxID=83186 RepID=UPI001C7E7C5D|nr:uncharacterized protein INS49_010635 [Diaporthe citri]KAG6362405.1 hypothetical protein INS49_010635 [Diaporthe citri]